MMAPEIDLSESHWRVAMRMHNHSTLFSQTPSHITRPKTPDEEVESWLFYVEHEVRAIQIRERILRECKDLSPKERDSHEHLRSRSQWRVGQFKKELKEAERKALPGKIERLRQRYAVRNFVAKRQKPETTGENQ
tara:strand:- start:1914 stop:2318 length:405 start_codon:yes stop_codon:yes gene_type:complete